ncbi:hypothetical protein IAD21_03547 [Abditibacteriota bacterium]|nr:hypothetical protein IAD21_03547 [Abditibacteriota bacterium]
MSPAKVVSIHLTILLLLCSLSGICRAHDLHLTGVKMMWNQSALTITVLTPASRLKTTNYDDAIRRHLKLRLDGAPIRPGKSVVTVDKRTDMACWQTRYASHVARIELLSRFYPEDVSSRVVLTVFREGRLVQETVLDSSHPSFAIGIHTQNVKPLTVAGRFLREGVLHIFGGIDHICFLLGLLLLGGSLSQLLKTVTAFTLAHSITLSLAVLSVLTPSPHLVEPLIAASIVAIAFDNLRVSKRGEQNQTKTRDWRPLIAFGFGLIHGFGFASALTEIGLPRVVLSWALVSFNIGVELGQSVIVLLVAPLLALLAHKQKILYGHTVLSGSCVIGAAGLFWLIQRLIST